MPCAEQIYMSHAREYSCTVWQHAGIEINKFFSYATKRDVAEPVVEALKEKLRKACKCERIKERRLVFFFKFKDVHI